MAKFKYSVDTAEFDIIRSEGMLYVDKTDMVYDIANNFRYVFLARPRRFGKSLLCNTLKAYFQGRKELFEGLKVMGLEKEWKEYPVLHFDMSIMKDCQSIDGMREALGDLLYQYERQYCLERMSDDPGMRFHQLLRHLSETRKEKVVVIIDEYDSPLMKNIYNESLREGVRSLLRSFYQTVKMDGSYLRFVFITGVTKFSQLSIFSELNNLYHISFDDKYSGICGITQEELDTVLRPCVSEFAQNLQITIEEAYIKLKKNYDGYHFSKNSKDVYAPFSLFRALKSNDLGYYWFESSTSSALIEHLNHYPEYNPFDFDGVELSLSAFNAPCERARTPIPMLYQSGYLTIESYDPEVDSYTLRFPNFEVRRGLVYELTNYLTDADDMFRDDTVAEMTRALNRSNLPKALECLRAYIASIPYDIISRKEWMAKKKREDFYKMLIYIVCTLLNNNVATELKSVKGRADIVIQARNDIFILELKVDQDVEVALNQIDNMGYAARFASDPRPVTKCGVCISSEQRTISHWRITDVHGNLIEDRIFESGE